jgi:hypothetical protein
LLARSPGSVDAYGSLYKSGEGETAVSLSGPDADTFSNQRDSSEEITKFILDMRFEKHEGGAPYAHADIPG